MILLNPKNSNFEQVLIITLTSIIAVILIVIASVIVIIKVSIRVATKIFKDSSWTMAFQ